MCVSGKIGQSRAVPLNAHHCTGCPVGGGIHARHALLAKTVFEEAEEGALQPVLEVSLSSESQSRPVTCSSTIGTLEEVLLLMSAL